MDNMEIIEGDNLEIISADSSAEDPAKAAISKYNRDAVRTKGIVHIRAYDAATGDLIEEHRANNLVVTGGRAALMEFIATGNPNKVIDTAGWGEGTAAPTSADTGLTNEYTNAISSAYNPAPTQAQFELGLDVTEGNGMVLGEIGLYCSDGTLFARFTWGGTIAKTSAMTVSASWIIKD